MKRVFVYFLSLILFTACSNKRVHPFKKRKYLPWFQQNSVLPLFETSNSFGITDESFKTASHSEYGDLNMPFLAKYLGIDTVIKEDTIVLSSDYIKGDAECDKLILKDNTVLEIVIKGIDDYSLVYKKCSNLKGPIYTKSTSEIQLIMCSDGTEMKFDEVHLLAPISIGRSKKDEVYTNSEKSKEPNGIFSLIFSILSALILPTGIPFWVLSITGIIFSVISVRRSFMYKDRYKRPVLPFFSGVLAIMTLIISILMLTGL
jgi:hypothetical protein